MKYLILFSMLLSASCFADPFNLLLPFNTQYAPGSLGKYEKAFTVGGEWAGDNFQLQLSPVTGVDRFIDTEPDGHIFLGFIMGLGNGFEVELDTGGNAGYASIKYSFKNPDSSLLHSFVLADISSEDYGHGGALLAEDDDCGFFDIGCWFSDAFNFFGGSNDRYEYDYQAEIRGLMLGYMQGYQYSAGVLPYWGVHYVDYDIGYTVTDNTGAGAHQSGHVNTDLMFLTLGVKLDVNQSARYEDRSSWLINYVAYQDSSLHQGDLSSEIRISYINHF